MPVLSIGDLANTFLIRRQTAGLKADLTRLGTELTTGRKHDLGKALAGDFGPFAAIQRSLSSLAAYKTANSEASSMLAAAQLALENVQGSAQRLGPALLTASNARNVTLISDALGQRYRLRISANALRTVEHRGGLDAFLAKAKDGELSMRARLLKRQIAKKIVEKAAA